MSNKENIDIGAHVDSEYGHSERNPYTPGFCKETTYGSARIGNSRIHQQPPNTNGLVIGKLHEDPDKNQEIMDKLFR